MSCIRPFATHFMHARAAKGVSICVYWFLVTDVAVTCKALGHQDVAGSGAVTK